MNCFEIKKTYYLNLDWHMATKENVRCSLQGIKCNYGFDDNEEQCIVKYFYKSHVHYIRYEHGRLWSWVPQIKDNINPIVDYGRNLIIASNLTQGVLNANVTNDVQVIIPDYSSVDVGVGKPWPNKVFAPYVDSTAWPPYSLVNSYNATKGLYYNLGFIVSKSGTICEPTWGTYYTGEAGPLNDQIKAIRSFGGDVTISFGGAANVPLHVVAPDVNSLYLQYKAFTEGYKLTRIDFDLEGIWIDPAYNDANIRNAQALKKLQDYYKSQSKKIDVWFTLPVLPTGLTASGLNILQLALNAGVEISGVNVMTMDYGDWAAPNPQGQMGQYGIQAITSLYNQLNTLYNGTKTSAQLWAMIGTTPMIGVNDVQSEVFTINDAEETLQFAQQNNIGMISMWSANRDMTGGSGISQSNYQFALVFEQYN